MLKNSFNIINLRFSPIIYTIMLIINLILINNFIWIKINKKYLIIFTIINILLFMLLVNIIKVLKENILKGNFNKKKKIISYNGFTLFIISEVIIFISLFWRYIHNAYTINPFIGNFWPPKGITPSNPTRIIIFGTSILLSSRIIIMIRHNILIKKNFKIKNLIYIIITIIIGIIFIDIQVIEISNLLIKLKFNFNDSIFRNSFLFTTSLHATHVIIGLLGLIISNYIVKKNINNIIMIITFETRIWYWHFVDYVWVIVFTIFYYLNR